MVVIDVSEQPISSIFKGKADQEEWIWTVLTSSPLKMGHIGFPETLVNKYQSTLRNIAEEQKYQIEKIISEFNKIKSTWNMMVVACRRALSRNLLGETEESHDISQSE